MIGEKKSDWSYISAGVPEVSILGQLLFLIYANDIIISIDSEILLFSHDTCLLEPVENPKKALPNSTMIWQSFLHGQSSGTSPLIQPKPNSWHFQRNYTKQIMTHSKWMVKSWVECSHIAMQHSITVNEKMPCDVHIRE